ncbi:MAG: phosphotransferase [Chthoniobacter sp.]|uniref:phosphotransferase n=1 Tax=Chthoniobacter sp. TaxID=2510640 RepID=UPI0032A2BEFC
MSHGKHRGSWFTDFYLLWLIGFAVLGLLRPETLSWFRGPWVVWALSLVMLGMGFTLTLEDFRRLFQMPGSLALGFLAHYTIMPLSGWAIARALHLEPSLAVGLILVASCPSGTASNVISFLARANVALAVMVTLTSTLLAFVMTPLWCKTLAGTYVPVDAAKLCLSTLQVAVGPVLMGVFCNWRFPRAVAKVSPFGPVVSVVAILFITGGIVALNAPAVIANAGKLLLAAALLHVMGFGIGYALARLLRYPEDVARTISIEVGMQNGGLAAVLARENFPAHPLTAVPAVFSGVVQNIVGSVLASFWRVRPPIVAPAEQPHPRRGIYYWKCDRAAAFHGTDEDFRRGACESQFAAVLRERFPGKPVTLRAAAGQGNHVTWLAAVNGTEYFARIEDGPERDDYIEVESRVLAEVRALGVPAPQVHGVDASRRQVPFAWQLLENIPCRDLNQLDKAGQIDVAQVAYGIGSAVARWQALQPRGFGPFDPAILRRTNQLEGFHRRYEDYFFLQLDRHLQFLVEREFLPSHEADGMKAEIERHRDLLALEQGCLVHKDLAFWNILGTAKEISAFIDWDDAISGDPMDDLSLLGCFHDGAFLTRALEGYQSIRPLPGEYRRRFWLHLLRNMIVKAVIRVGAGYFERGDRFFLIGTGSGGEDLRRFTQQRIALALRGLQINAELSIL